MVLLSWLLIFCCPLCLSTLWYLHNNLSRASRLGREHHDDLAQFMLGMGYATEALHLPGISKRYAA